MSAATERPAPDNIAKAVLRCMLLSPGEAMRQDEIAAGNVIIRSGDVDWLPAADWVDDVVVSRDGEEVRIVAILARTMGAGAFSRLTARICAAGLTPVVIAPMGIMPTILRHWGWRRTQHGSGWTAEERWRPRSKAWMRGRAALALAAHGPERGETAGGRADG